MENLLYADADRGLRRPGFFLPGCPGAGEGRRLQDILDPICRAKAQLILQLFLLLSVGEEGSRRNGEKRRTTKKISIIIII